MSDEELAVGDLVDSDDEVVADEHKHNQLLDAISSLDGKKKHRLSQRTVLSNQISEFNFTSSKDAGSRVRLHELLGTLKDSTGHGELKKQLRAVDRSKKVASVPLPKHEKAKIDRTVAYEKTTVDLSKWDPVVKQNRNAEQTHFPLQKPDFRLITTDQFVKRFHPRTPLEQQVAALLHGSDNILKGPEQELTPAEQRALKAMDVEEAKERRRELMKHRALLSYKEAKAKRQKKIKSKQYHRILKKERLKQEGKEIDSLRQTDPEGFMDKLKLMERDRVTERISQKHRGGSKFARRQMIYAKFDDRARDQVQDMIQKSKELTKKLNVDMDSDDEVVEDVDDSGEGLESAHDLYAGTETANPWMAKPKVQTKNLFSRPSEVRNDESHTGMISDEESVELSKSTAADLDSIVVKAISSVTASETKDLDRSLSDENGDNIEKDAIDDIFGKTDEKSDVGEVDEKRKRKRSTKRKLKKRGEKNSETNTVKEKKKKKVENDAKSITDANTEKKGENDSAKAVDQANYHSDDDGLISESLTRKRTLEDIEKEDEGNSGFLPIKAAKIVKPEANHKEKKKVASVPTDAFVDPNKVFTMETKIRQVGTGPDIIDGSDDDSDLDAEEQQRMTIAQAFADDDVIDEFSQEKADDIEKSKPKDIDLSIPGWGDWGGEGIRKKKNRRRFIIKAPPAAPRSDQHLGHVIINDAKIKGLAKHQVNSIPFPYKNSEQFEQSIRAPIGRTWNPETAFQSLVQPKVVTHLGKIITPIEKAEVFKDMKRSKTEEGEGQGGSKKYKHNKSNKGHKSKGHVKSGRQLKNRK